VFGAGPKVATGNDVQKNDIDSRFVVDTALSRMTVRSMFSKKSTRGTTYAQEGWLSSGSQIVLVVLAIDGSNDP